MVKLAIGSDNCAARVISKAIEGDFATQRDVSCTKRDIRALDTSVAIPNPRHTLVPGMTAQVILPAANERAGIRHRTRRQALRREHRGQRRLTSRSSRARRSDCSARTAPARAHLSECSRRSCRSRADASSSTATTSRCIQRGATLDRRHAAGDDERHRSVVEENLSIYAKLYGVRATIVAG